MGAEVLACRLCKGGSVRKVAFLVGLLAALIGLSVARNGDAGPLQPNATFTGGVAFSADAVGADSLSAGARLRVDTSAVPSTQDVTVKAAYLYNVTFSGSSPVSTQALLGGTIVTLNRLNGTDPTDNNLQTYRSADLTSIIAPLGTLPGGITTFFTASLNTIDPQSDGLALVVVFSSPTLDARRSVAIIDGGQAGPAFQTTTFGVPNGVDKSIPGFNAILSLGIQFSMQGFRNIGTPPLPDPHTCGQFDQYSTVDVNGQRLTSCAGNADDFRLPPVLNGNLITVGGVGDSTDNPFDPLCQAGNLACIATTDDDELYNLAFFLNQGVTQVQLTTSNPTNNDSIFLGILQLTACINQINGVSQGDCGLPPPPPPPPG